MHPGAPEVAGNLLDDDCVGGDAPAKIGAVVTVKWEEHRAGGVRLNRFEVKDAPPGAQIAVRCRGRRCFKQRTHARFGGRHRQAAVARPEPAAPRLDTRRHRHGPEHDRQGPPLRRPQAGHDRRPDLLPDAGSEERFSLLSAGDPVKPRTLAANARRNANGGARRMWRWRATRAAAWALLERHVEPGATVAVVGAGNGHDLPLRRLGRSAGRLDLIDLDPIALRGTRRRLRLAGVSATTITQDVTGGVAELIIRDAVAQRPVRALPHRRRSARRRTTS